jgi:hypothetical protein
MLYTVPLYNRSKIMKKLCDGYESSLYKELAKRSSQGDFNGSFEAFALLLGSGAALLPTWGRAAALIDRAGPGRALVLGAASGAGALAVLTALVASPTSVGKYGGELSGTTFMAALACYTGYVCCWQCSSALFSAEAARNAEGRAFATVFVGLNAVSLVLQSILQFAVTSGLPSLMDASQGTVGKYEVLAGVGGATALGLAFSLACIGGAREARERPEITGYP